MGKKLGRKLLKFAKNTAVAGSNVLMPGAGKVTQETIDLIESRVRKSIKNKRKRERAKARISGKGMYRSGSMGVSGSGSYVTNSLVSGGEPSSVPSFGGDNDGSVVLERVEYLGDIVAGSSTAFTLQSFPLNPGLESTFPWGSQIADNYDEYTMDGLIFTYKPVVTAYNTAGVSGTVMLSTQYNANALPFASKQQMIEYSGTVTGRTCDTIVHGVECDPSKRSTLASLMVRAGAVPSGEDIKTYDLGIFSLGLSGVTYDAGTQLGELWVSYRMRLRKPKFYTAIGYAIQTDRFWAAGTGQSAALIMGTAPFKSSANGIGGTLTKSGASTYTFPDSFQGYVMILMTVEGVAISGSLATFFQESGNVSYTNAWTTNGTSSVQGNYSSGGSNTNLTAFNFFTVLPATLPGGNTITFVLTSATSIASASFEVFEVNHQMRSLNLVVNV